MHWDLELWSKVTWIYFLMFVRVRSCEKSTLLVMKFLCLHSQASTTNKHIATNIIIIQHLTILFFSLARGTSCLLSFFANLMLSLWMMLLRQISSMISSQLSTNELSLLMILFLLQTSLSSGVRIKGQVEIGYYQHYTYCRVTQWSETWILMKQSLLGSALWDGRSKKCVDITQVGAGHLHDVLKFSSSKNTSAAHHDTLHPASTSTNVSDNKIFISFIQWSLEPR